MLWDGVFITAKVLKKTYTKHIIGLQNQQKMEKVNLKE